MLANLQQSRSISAHLNSPCLSAVQVLRRPYVTGSDHIPKAFYHLLRRKRFWKKRLFTGLSHSDNSALPDAKMILIAGHRSWTVRASAKPSMLPGIWMSVKSSAMSERLSSMTTASSAFAASKRVDHPRRIFFQIDVYAAAEESVPIRFQPVPQGGDEPDPGYPCLASVCRKPRH
jgi:hypothetical protein